MSPDRLRPPARRRVFPLVALVVTASLALLLWGSAVWQTGANALMSATAERATGEVVSCSAEVISGCVVRYAAPSGRVETSDIDRPGLIGVTTGDVVPLWLTGDGAVAVAGWRPWVDAALLAAFAVAMSFGSARWLPTVLREGDRLADYDDVDLDLDVDRGDAWGHDSRDAG
ncbi:hypothetical protein [Mobilicoccus massiliensis]|uniref:hypothetical protein n=1 Tax=Mobilicoccus massiliensis TaxID=1522310 RepID=UPI00058E344F|nr:hypothetical protein [Mobilicoccus massiliensis]